MELGLSLGDAPSKTTTGVDKSTLGFCMALGITTTHDQHKEKPQSNDDDDDEFDDDDDEHEKDDENTLKEKGEVLNIVSHERLLVSSSSNPPIQLDLLPSGPVNPHTSFPWSPDNGSSEGGSSGNVAAGRGLEVRRMPVGTEEATSSFRLEFTSYNGRNIGRGSKNSNKRGFELGNDVVEVERASSRASDEDDNGMSRKKLRLSKEQSAYLEETFKEHTTLNPKQKLALAERLNLRPRQVEVWFQNRRARTKLKQTEVDYEYLKRCCETLTDENRILHKELQQLRALKTTSNPFYMQRPATTLTMCPSCERVATTSNVVPTSASTKQAVEQNSKKTRSLVFPVSKVEPSSNSQQQHATQ